MNLEESMYKASLLEEKHKDAKLAMEREQREELREVHKAAEFSLIQKRLYTAVYIINNLIAKRFPRFKHVILPEFEWTIANFHSHTYSFKSKSSGLGHGLHLKGSRERQWFYVPEVFYKGTTKDIASYARDVLYSANLRECHIEKTQAENRLSGLLKKKKNTERFKEDLPETPARKLVSSTIDEQIERSREQVKETKRNLKNQSLKYSERVSRRLA